ncbi:MAG: integrase arm-type DNA-binding domain-containing protein [Burkholderiaceae bacterium]|nr:integrase arm-type DNA-binding domain-containing protein [Burkholderiaceae bacterium]
MKPTDAKFKNAQCPPDSKQKKFYDTGGLFLLVTPNGSKLWRWKYRIRGKEKLFSLGSYPEITLAQARSARDAQRQIKDGGKDPSMVRKQAQLKVSFLDCDTFRAIAQDWYAKKHTPWSRHYAIREQRNLEKDLYPYLATLRMAEIEPQQLLAVLRKVEERGSYDVAHRVLATARSIWRYAVAIGAVKVDITACLKQALNKHVGKHFSAIIEPKALGALLRSIDVYQGSAGTKAALQLSPMLFQRPGEIRGMTWAELDLEKAIWTIPAMRMKRRIEGKLNGDAHIVPLPKQAVEILKNLQLKTGHGELVFPGQRFHDRPISDNTLRAALAALGYGPDK